MNVTMLLVEDDEGLRSSLERSFRRKGHEILTSATVSGAKDILSQRKVDLVLLDLRLPDGSGLEILTHARQIDPEIVVITMTAFPEVKTAVRAMKDGARDFVVKPFELEELHLTVGRALETLELGRKVRRLERIHRHEATDILGESPAIRSVKEQISKVAGTDAGVLVIGDTGTGKELVVDWVHQLSNRAAGPLIKVNCSAFSEQLLESELFGHDKGAFTDAKSPRPGLFEMASGGTLFLDEVSEMKRDLQAKLLRVVEDQVFRRLGGQREIHTNVRVLAATNRDLPRAIERGEFRQDLYFRLNVFEIKVPPLRVRGADIILLARHFLRRLAATLRKGTLRLTPRAEEILLAYSWPGNVRELRNVLERAAILCEQDEIDVEHLPRELQASGFVRSQFEGASSAAPSLREIERRYVLEVLARSGGNLSEAARILGIARNTLKAKLGAAEGEPT